LFRARLGGAEVFRGQKQMTNYNAIAESNNFIVLERINEAILKIRFYCHRWDKDENYD